MYGLSGCFFGWFSGWIKTDNTAYQALVLIWLWCGKNGTAVIALGIPKVAPPLPWLSVKLLKLQVQGNCLYFPSEEGNNTAVGQDHSGTESTRKDIFKCKNMIKRQQMENKTFT